MLFALALALVSDQTGKRSPQNARAIQVRPIRFILGVSNILVRRAFDPDRIENGPMTCKSMVKSNPQVGTIGSPPSLSFAGVAVGSLGRGKRIIRKYYRRNGIASIRPQYEQRSR